MFSAPILKGLWVKKIHISQITLSSIWLFCLVTFPNIHKQILMQIVQLEMWSAPESRTKKNWVVLFISSQHSFHPFSDLCAFVSAFSNTFFVFLYFPEQGNFSFRSLFNTFTEWHVLKWPMEVTLNMYTLNMLTCGDAHPKLIYQSSK